VEGLQLLLNEKSEVSSLSHGILRHTTHLLKSRIRRLLAGVDIISSPSK